MNGKEIIHLLPHLSIAGAALAVTLALAIRRNHAIAAGLTILGLAAAVVLSPVAVGRGGPHAVTDLLIVDGYATFFIVLISAAGIALTLLAYDYWRLRTRRPEEFYLLLLLATLGSAVLVSSNHLASAFLGLETLSVALYGLVAYRRQDRLGIEAGLKYLILAGVSSAFLLFGMALVYAERGTMTFSGLLVAESPQAAPPLLVKAGLSMMLVGFGFKLALVPFHLWTPDVYQGATAPAAGFVATVSKGAMFALFVRLFAPVSSASASLTTALAILAIASMFAGNLLALRQRRVKRILAYSSIAHMGYLLVAFLAEPAQTNGVVAFYLVAYFLSMIAAFGVIGAVSPRVRDADAMRDFRGLAWRQPWLSAVLSAAVFSLAGIPLTAGFLGKFQVLAAGVGAGLWSLMAILVVNSAIGLYYYLRIIVVMYQDPAKSSPHTRPDSRFAIPLPTVSLASGAALSVVLLLLLWIGVYPGPLLSWIQIIGGGSG